MSETRTNSGPLVVGVGISNTTQPKTGPHYWEIQKRLDRWEARMKAQEATIEMKANWLYRMLRSLNHPALATYFDNPDSPWNKPSTSQP